MKKYRVIVEHRDSLNITGIALTNYAIKKMFESWGLTVLPYESGIMYVYSDPHELAEFLLNYRGSLDRFSFVEA